MKTKELCASLTVMTLLWRLNVLASNFPTPSFILLLPFIHFSYFRIHHVGQLHLATYMHARKLVLYSIACKFCRSSSISHTHVHTISPHRYHINTILSFLDTQITDLVGYSHLCKIFSLISHVYYRYRSHH